MPGVHHPVVVGFKHIFSYPPEPAIPESDTGDVAIYVISRHSGEGCDRKYRKGDYLLADWEKSNLLLLRRQFRHVIVLLNVGGIIDTTFLREESGADAILLVGQGGSACGNAVADVLIGKTIPSGRLTDTWAKHYADYPASDTFSDRNGNLDDEYYNEGIFVGYRHFDKNGIEPAYCFGYGKSYTDFQIESTGCVLHNGKIRLSVRVTNTGSVHPGKEVVQVYCTLPAGRLDKPMQVLTGFNKTSLLSPGESETLKISFPVASVASFDSNLQAWCLEPGEYSVLVGNSSRNTKTVFRWSVVQEQRSEITRETASPRTQLADCHPGKVLTLDDVRSGHATLPELVAQLSLEELAALCVGSNPGNSQNIVGSAARQVPGACGETTGILMKQRKIPPILFADGPAGLRLKQHFQSDDGVDYYQFCTAIPIATMLAQSWDTKLLTKCGDIVGSEMEQYHINIWLAPGMNIHRNPLCGRNFEYFSEDPLLSGLCAAAETKGVQQHKGCSVALKHYACNNQENNRMFNNVHVGSQALREIYLRGFEIAVKEAHPHCIMTAYNLVNGIHAANHYELLQQILREEWGFTGFVMTDWQATQNMAHIGELSSKYPYSSSVLCIKAGNDLLMPGCVENIDDILTAAQKNDQIAISDLQFCASNILSVILKLTGQTSPIT